MSLIRSAGVVLLDVVPSETLARQIRDVLEVDGDRVADLHLWRLGPGHAGLIVSIVTHRPQQPAVYKRKLAGVEGLSHVTVEVQLCEDMPLAA